MSSNPFQTFSAAGLDSLMADILDVDLSNLYAVIDRANVHGLNLGDPESARELIKPWDKREDEEKFVDSNVDDELMIHIPFTENVRIKSILLKVGRGERAPRYLDIHLNHPNIVDFDNAESLRPQLALALSEGETGVTEYPVRVAAFTSVHSLSLFFKNPGNDSSRVYFIGFRGDRRSVKPEGSSKITVPAPSAAEAPLGGTKAETKPGTRPTAR